MTSVIGRRTSSATGSTPSLVGLTVPAHHRLLSQNPSLPLGMCGLLLQVETPRLDFVPLHPLLLGFLLTPAWTAKSRQPPINQQHRQLRSSPRPELSRPFEAALALAT